MRGKGILLLNTVLVLCSCSAIAAADDHEAGLAAQFKAAAPAERAKLARNLSYRNDTPAMVAALLPLLEGDDAELAAVVLRRGVERGLARLAEAPVLPRAARIESGQQASKVTDKHATWRERRKGQRARRTHPLCPMPIVISRWR